VSTRRLVDFLIPDALAMQFDWVRNAVRGDKNLLAAIAQSPTARRLLNRRVQSEHRIAVPGSVELAPNQRWLLSTPAQQVDLARRLGFEALRGFIRTAVRASHVGLLRKVLGEDGYREALSGAALSVVGLERAHFDAALERGELADHAVSVGIALLETTTPADDSFCRLRMRFAFSRACWSSRPQNLCVDDAELARRLVAKEA
jgi:hypothetical protein